jgi:curved DNA-binding protein CbpA
MAGQVVTNRDLYEVLGIERDATESQIKRAYHKLALCIPHPK